MLETRCKEMKDSYMQNKHLQRQPQKCKMTSETQNYKESNQHRDENNPKKDTTEKCKKKMKNNNK